MVKGPLGFSFPLFGFQVFPFVVEFFTFAEGNLHFGKSVFEIYFKG
jgi:hypothetical protein